MTEQNQKRVLICSTDYLPHIGGAELAVHEIAKRLVLQGFVFDLITARLETGLPYYEFIDGVHVHRVGFGFWFDKFLLPVLGLLKYVSLRRRPYDMVWSLMASQGSVLASFISFFSKSKVVLTLQEGDDEEHLERYAGGNPFVYKIFIQPWHRLVFKRAHHITVISNYLKERARKWSRAPVDLVPNGVHISQFAHVDNQLVTDIKKLYNLEDKKVIVSVSRLVKKNNIPLLIKALPYLDEQIILLLVGDGSERVDLEKLVSNLRLEQRVVFVGGVAPGLVPVYLHASDIFARVSLSEGLGSAFLEAFAAGTPVIASREGGITDIVIDKETGLCVDPQDEKGFADAVKHILTDEHLRRNLIDNGHVFVQKYTWDSVSEQMRHVFEKL